MAFRSTGIIDLVFRFVRLPGIRLAISLQFPPSRSYDYRYIEARLITTTFIILFIICVFQFHYDGIERGRGGLNIVEKARSNDVSCNTYFCENRF